MKDVTRPLRIVAAPACLLVLIFLGVSCSSPTYESPAPGTLTIKLRTISTVIPFSPYNNFTFTIQQLQANRNDGNFLEVFQDSKTVKLTPSTYNTLDTTARDSEMVLGTALAPPGTYTSVQMAFNPSNEVILDGYRIIPVNVGSDFSGSSGFYRDYTISSGQTTTLTLTINLDRTLVKGAEVFYFNNYFYMSSVKYN